ncbi:MAG TPA: hypothetical protein PKM17_13360 [Syntrophorhabdus sp.]|jgi:phage gpG-like protein|nr:hypothetical protein [Syntrophorhabdus sp.]
MYIEIKVDDKNVVSLLNKLSKKVENMTPAMRIIAGMEENFVKEGRPKWTPLAQATIKQREKKG